MTPFDHRHCVCFREETVKRPACRDTSRSHDACCARRGRPETTAVFLHPSGYSDPLHHFLCNCCLSGYQWTLIGRRVFLRRLHKLPTLGCFWSLPTSGGPSFVRTRPDMDSFYANKIIRLLDTNTYQGNRFSKQKMLCNQRGCWNSRNSKTNWIVEA